MFPTNNNAITIYSCSLESGLKLLVLVNKEKDRERERNKEREKERGAKSCHIKNFVSSLSSRM